MYSSLPTGWKIGTLGDFAQIKGGKRLPKGEKFSAVRTDYPYIRVTDFKGGTVNCSDLRFVNKAIRDKIHRYVISSDDLYISIAGTLGLVGDVPKKLDGALLTENAAKIVFKSRLSTDKRFYKYFLNGISAQEHFNQAKGTGGGVPKLALFRIEDTQVFVPPFPEQKKIAAILTSVDDVIEKTQAQIDKLKDLKTGMMQELLTRGVGVDGKPHTEFKDSPVGRIPWGWEVKELGQLVDSSSPICYGILMPGKNIEGGVPVIKVKDIKNNQIIQDCLLLTAPEIDEKYKRSRVKQGDILLTIRGTTGRLAIVPLSLSGANITQDTARVRIGDPELSQFIYTYLQSSLAQQQIEDNTIGQAVKGINLLEVRKLLVVIPSVREMKLISTSVSSVESKLSTSSAYLAKLRNLKKALMQDLLTGKVRVKVDS